MHRWFNGKDYAMYTVCSYEGDTNNVRRVIPGFALIGFIIFLNYILNKVIWYVCSI
jgi:hypothetical protein